MLKFSLTCHMLFYNNNNNSSNDNNNNSNNNNREFTERLNTQSTLQLKYIQCVNTLKNQWYTTNIFFFFLMNMFIQSMVKYTQTHDRAHARICKHANTHACTHTHTQRAVKQNS